MTSLVILTPEELETLVRRAVRAELDARQPPEVSDVMTREQAAKLLGVNPHQIPKLVRRGMPAFRLGVQWRFRRSAVLRWFEEQPATTKARKESKKS